MTPLRYVSSALLMALSAAGLYACGSDFDPAAGGSKDAGSDSASGGSAGASSGGTAGTPAGGSGGSSASGGSGGSSASGGSGGGCPGGHQCVAPAPSGWSGPVLRATSCSGAWSQSELTLHAGLTAPPAQCACACAPKVTCPTSLTWASYDNVSCTGFTSSEAMAPGACKIKSAFSHGATMAAATPGCTPSVTETIPAIAWATDEELCGGASEGGTCAESGELCLPSEAGKLCIYQAGDATCPAEYPDKAEAFTGATDTRDCPASCTCTPGGNAQCNAHVFTFAGSQCTAVPALSLTVTSGVATAQCTGNAPAAQAGSISPSAMGTCAGSAVTPTGTATPSGQHTVCCTAS